MGAIGNFFSDLKVLIGAATTKPPQDNDPGSLGLIAQQNAVSAPNDIALLCEEEILTWQELNVRVNRVAHSLKALGVSRGDCVSLFMQNRIEFVVCLLGINKLGAIAGLINTNLTHKPLVHCINLIESKKCIFGEELTESVSQVLDELNLTRGEDYLWVRDKSANAAPDWAILLDSENAATEASDPPETAQITLGELGYYIFTSGTTGLPKAARVSYKRSLPTGKLSGSALLRITKADRMYNCLPLYHGTGLMVGLMAAFQTGASTVIRRRLSVSAFWDDIRKYQCTSFVYIGEFIRYLMSRPAQDNDHQNPVRAIVGNGLRPDIWMEFKNRFDIERIGEFYGASEGNGGFANVLNKPCTVGMGVAPVKIVAYDVANDEIIRDANGRCIVVEEGEPGLLLIQVTEKSKFEGYTNAKASEDKLISNVIEDGDLYFNSGDLMKTVKVGFAFGQKHYQFVDRIGDTFRWKSENVSTNEVAEIINSFDDIIFTNVYGVEIPGADGKAGMAAVVLREGVSLAELDLQALTEHIAVNLPAYARPLFLRILKELPTTTTHKLQKNELRDQAYHLASVSDDLLVLKPGAPAYVRLDTDFYDQIMARSVAF
ncbi:MAG: long-chain-acyl-CoA synthetase [Pseudomonadales bacterium]|nr:long-chain-acyl-CoA synthetase [Pseudomonadales bacterium]